MYRNCCCACCGTTSYLLTGLPSITYTLACGTNNRYTDGGGNTFNLNTPGYGLATQAVSSPVPECFNKCYWVTAPAEYQYHGTFYATCGSACANWSFYNAWSINIVTDNQSPGVRWAIVNMSHVWYSPVASGPCVVAPFSVGVKYKKQISGLCPDGAYSSYTTTSLTRCNGVAETLGVWTNIAAGGPTVTWGTASGVPTVA